MKVEHYLIKFVGQNRLQVKEYFKLDGKEKQQERIMIILFFITIATIGTGIYFQSQNLNYNNILIPVFLLFAGCFLLLNGYNGVTKGNLILKYTPVGIPFLMQYLLRKVTSFSSDRARTATAKTLGVLSLLMAVVCFFFILLI